MTMLGQVGLELIEESSATFPHTERGQAVALRARIIKPRLGESVLHEPAKCRVHRHAVVDEAEDVRGADIRAEAFPMKPEHDL
jgi:hypothetical protein